MLRFLNNYRRPQNVVEDTATRLFRENTALVYGLCLRYLGTPERAEDAAMEIYQVLRRKLPEHEVSNPISWLHTLTRNHCLIQLRKEKREPEFVQPETVAHQLLNTEIVPPDTRPLHHCLKTLNEVQARCVRLFYLTEGESYRSIAERLDLSLGRVRSHLQNGRRNLQICLEKYAEREA